MATVTKPIALDESFNTTEVTPRNIADVLAEGFSHITGRTASEVEYDNTDSGLTADNVQDALDEIVEDIPTVPSVDIQTAVDEFETYNGGLLSSLKVSLTPNQDLHGYDSPWVGGAGKNKFSLANSTVSGAGVDYSYVSATGTLSKSGTSTGSGGYNIGTITVAQGEYTLSADFSHESGSGTQIILRDVATDTNVVTLTANNPTRNVTLDGEYYVRLATSSGATSGYITDIQLEVGSTATTFEPYSNICPISGHTEVKVGDDGKNRFNPNSYESIDITGGGAVRYGHSYDSGDYTISNNGNGINYYYRIPKKDLTDRGTSINITGNAEINVSVDNAHMLWVFTSDITMADAEDISVIKGLNKPYVPYNGYQVTVNLGGTYYSGTLDVVSGVFTPDTAEVDLGTLTWTKDSSKAFYAFITDSLTGLQDMWCEVLDPYPVNYQLNKYNDYPDNIIARNSTQKNVYVKCTTYEDGTASDFRTAMSGYKLVYTLATPTPIQLSPTMVKALVGENHLSAPLDGQEITESKYKQMFTFDDVIAYIQSLS